MRRKLKAIESKIEKAEKELQEVKEELATLKVTRKLPQPKIGDEIEIADMKWKVLDKTDKGFLCLAERIKEGMQFDSSCNDWTKSALRKYLNTEFLEKLASEVGEENIVSFQRDLLSLDGQTEYGMCEDKVSLVTVDEYRIYRSMIPNTENYWWWTITPDSTKCNNDSRWVRVVSPSGDIRNCNFDYFSFDDDGAVRPFCIFHLQSLNQRKSKCQTIN
ncbi:MAG: hypothetical protein IJA54_08015 [Tyzzerella sp.]|nr:hypothetical protein [Tyzzerella sp.]